MATMLDAIRQVARGEAPPSPVATLIGFRLASVEPGRAVIEFKADERHANPMGTVHGEVLCDVADAAMGIAYATGRVVSVGRTVGLVECDVHDENERLVARATTTCMTLRGEQAVGR